MKHKEFLSQVLIIKRDKYMALIILDEEFYTNKLWYSDKENEYLIKFLTLTNKYIDAPFAIFVPNENIADIWTKRNNITYINREIQKRCAYKIYDSSSIIPTVDNSFKDVSPSFIGEIYTLLKEEDEVFIAAPLIKHKKDIKEIITNVYVINHITRELDSNFSNWISEQKYTKNIITPTQKSPLPNTQLTSEYLDLLIQKLHGKNNSERIPIILEVSSEVLRRNGYKYEKVLSAINTSQNKIREIYSADSGKIFGSIDFDSGSIEICYKNGKHNDEYGLNNKIHNKHDSTGCHDIKLHK